MVVSKASDHPLDIHMRALVSNANIASKRMRVRRVEGISIDLGKARGGNGASGGVVALKESVRVSWSVIAISVRHIEREPALAEINWPAVALRCGRVGRRRRSD